MDLGNFEDLYYAACAKIKGFLHKVDILIGNGFKRPREDFFEFDSLPLASLGPVKLDDFKACLLAIQTLLQGEQLVQLLDNAIKGQTQCHQQGAIPQKCFHSCTIPQLCQSAQAQGNTKTAISDGAQHSTESSGLEGLAPSRNLSHLLNVSNMSSGMIFAYLAEKYRVLSGRDGFNSQPEVGPLINGPPVRPNLGRYISPYNLEERAKKLDDPGRPEMPCICDPECICALLCASDPDQNCLCEENGLFARVTEGMDIDDLDVPDLVRRKRHSPGSSKFNLTYAPDYTQLERDVDTPWKEVVDSAFDEKIAIEEIAMQGDDQISQVRNDLDFSSSSYRSATPLDEIICSKTGLEPSASFVASFYQDQVSHRSPWGSGLFHQDTLVRPFAKQCDTPPKRQRARSSVTKRFFGSPFYSSLPEASKGRQGTKRTLTDVSLPTLKRTFRR